MEFHLRQWVDGYFPAYGSGLEVLNPTNDSWWKFHFLPKLMAGNEQSTDCRWWDLQR